MTTLTLFVLTCQYFILLIHVPGRNTSKEGEVYHKSVPGNQVKLKPIENEASRSQEPALAVCLKQSMNYLEKIVSSHYSCSP